MTAIVAAMGPGGVVAAAPLGLLIGLILGALGGGGGVLAVPALVYVVGESAHDATTISLLTVGTTALVATIRNLRTGSIQLGAGLIFGLVGLGGNLLGSRLSAAVPSRVLLLAFSVLILMTACRMHKRSTAPSVPATRAAARQHGRWMTVVQVALAGSVVGFLAGFFGVGGGFVIVPALVMALHYDMSVAVGTSLLVMTINAAAGLIFRHPSSDIDWSVVIPFTVASLIGVLAGGAIADRMPAAKLTRLFVWLLVLTAGYTAARSILQG